MTDWLIYLLKVSACQIVFYFVYLWLFQNLSFFQVNRVYILSTTLLSFLIPLFNIPFWGTESMELLALSELKGLLFDDRFMSSTQTAQDSISSSSLLIVLAFLTYLIGVTVQSWKLLSSILKVSRLVRNHQAEEHTGFKVIYHEGSPPVFAFLNYVFINTKKLSSSSDDFQQVVAHERSHVAQRHGVDNLFMELAILLCWFNPFLKGVKKALTQVHEFYADQQALKYNTNKDAYSKLILRLSSTTSLGLTNQFSMFNIKKRIIMINKVKNHRRELKKYFLTLPILLLLMTVFSFTTKTFEKENGDTNTTSGLIIESITWEGNTVYKDAYLSDLLGLAVGSAFNEEATRESMNWKADGSDLSSMYMDKGYLFFSVDMQQEIDENQVHLRFAIFEGEVTRINNVQVVGNNKVPSKKILQIVDLKKGDLFSRSELIAAQKELIDSGLFDPETVVPTPKPLLSNGKSLVDIVFSVTEL